MPVASVLERLLRAPAILIPMGQSSDAPHLANERIRRTNLIKGKVRCRQGSFVWLNTVVVLSHHCGWRGVLHHALRRLRAVCCAQGVIINLLQGVAQLGRTATGGHATCPLAAAAAAAATAAGSGGCQAKPGADVLHSMPMAGCCPAARDEP